LYRHDARNVHGLSDGRVAATREGATGKLWVGTFGGGLKRFDPSTNRFLPFPPLNSRKPGRVPRVITSLLPDSKGNLWLGTRIGLYKYNIESGTSVSFTEDDEENEREEGSEGSSSESDSGYVTSKRFEFEENQDKKPVTVATPNLTDENQSPSSTLIIFNTDVHTSIPQALPPYSQPPPPTSTPTQASASTPASTASTLVLVPTPPVRPSPPSNLGLETPPPPSTLSVSFSFAPAPASASELTLSGSSNPPPVAFGVSTYVVPTGVQTGSRTAQSLTTQVSQPPRQQSQRGGRFRETPKKISLILGILGACFVVWKLTRNSNVDVRPAGTAFRQPEPG
jgi:hypothetical protein